MLNLLQNKWETWKMRARYERTLQEQMLDLLDSSHHNALSEHANDWIPLNQQSPELGKRDWNESEREEYREQARRLVLENPYARNVLRLMEIYVVGPELQVRSKAVSSQTEHEQSRELIQKGNTIWRQFREQNQSHFSFREYARRTWRDGECFLRFFPSLNDIPSVRFIDAEQIGDPAKSPVHQGILTDAEDVQTPIAYFRIDPIARELRETISAEELLHTKINADTNQKRGVTFLASVMQTLNMFDAWRETELTARKLQASIVLWRRVQGGPTAANALADALRSTEESSSSTNRRERYRPGSMITTSSGTELQFLSPQTNFGDAVPLGRMLLLSIAAGTGIPEFMLTADASNANFSSTMVAEGPAVKLFESEQHFFTQEFTRLWKMVMTDAIRRGELPGDVLEFIQPDWTLPQLVNRDRNQERLSCAKLTEINVLSRSEVARREGVDPELMQQEIQEEQRKGFWSKGEFS